MAVENRGKGATGCILYTQPNAIVTLAGAADLYRLQTIVRKSFGSISCRHHHRPPLWARSSLAHPNVILVVADRARVPQRHGMQEIVPSSVSCGSSLKQLQLRLRVEQETCPSKDWLLAVEGSTEAQGQGAPAGSAVFGSYEHGAYDVTIRWA